MGALLQPVRKTLLAVGLLLAATAWAAPRALDDEELAAVNGAGIAIGVHLALNAGLLDGDHPQANLMAGFNQQGQKTWLMLHGVGGVMDLLAVTLDIRQRPDNGGDVVVIGLPQFAGFDHFGFRALSVQSDPNAPISGNFGALWLNGTMTMQGHVLMWAR